MLLDCLLHLLEFLATVIVEWKRDAVSNYSVFYFVQRIHLQLLLVYFWTIMSRSSFNFKKRFFSVTVVMVVEKTSNANASVFTWTCANRTKLNE